MWKQISSKEIFKNKRITLIEDIVELPGGEQTDYLRYKDTGEAVNVLAQREDGKFALQREFFYPYNDYLYGFSGGGVNKGEEVEIAANRELAEEIGYKANTLQFMGKCLLNSRRMLGYGYCYLATELVAEKLEGDIEEDIILLWKEEAEIDEMIRYGEIVKSSALILWQFYKLHK